MADERIELVRQAASVYRMYCVLGAVACACVGFGAAVTVYVTANPWWSLWLLCIPAMLTALMHLNVNLKTHG